MFRKANYFGLDELQQMCTDYMSANINTKTSLVFFAELFGDSIPFDHIVQKCLRLIRMLPQESAFNHPHWTTLQREAVRQILSSDVINCDEYTLFGALVAWLRAQHPDISRNQLKSMANDLENCIRWSTLSMDEFERILTVEPEFFSEQDKIEMKGKIGLDTNKSVVKRRYWFWNRKMQ